MSADEARDEADELRDEQLSRVSVDDSDLAPQADSDLEVASADDDSYEDISGRQPNLERVRGLTGERIVADWPTGARCFEAEQKLAPDGEWRLDGSWKAWYPNGQIEELGSYRADREHGFWRWWYEDGRPMAEGSFDDGVRNGRWRFTHRNGSPLSVGDYTAGKRSGRWTFWYDFGEIDEDHSGVYRDGVRVED